MESIPPAPDPATPDPEPEPIWMTVRFRDGSEVFCRHPAIFDQDRARHLAYGLLGEWPPEYPSAIWSEFAGRLLERSGIDGGDPDMALYGWEIQRQEGIAESWTVRDDEPPDPPATDPGEAS